MTVTLGSRRRSKHFAYLLEVPVERAHREPELRQAGVAAVDVRIDGGPALRYYCREGHGGARCADPDADRRPSRYRAVGGRPGRLRLLLDAQHAGHLRGLAYPREYGLRWAVGGVSLRWQLTDGTYGLSCRQAGVDTMT